MKIIKQYYHTRVMTSKDNYYIIECTINGINTEVGWIDEYWDKYKFLALHPEDCVIINVQVFESELDYIKAKYK